ncbi:hypothetical protein [Paenibacillus sp. NPDC057934]|uniref:hypothetical protein n=1 Tax=Paenibacillus sp. NPDC057934 TaxID=3346282 RepID=UPI0036DB2B83
MVEALLGKEVAIHFLDGTSVRGGVLKGVGGQYLKYLTEYQEMYIPITSIQAVTLDIKEHVHPRIGFAQ